MDFDFSISRDNHIDAKSLFIEGEADGFITEENMVRGQRSFIPELGSGMLPAFWSEGYKLTTIYQDEKGCYTKNFGQAAIPLVFAINVAEEGNFRVNIKLTAAKKVTDALIFLGRRRLVDKISLDAGESFEGEYLLNVSPIIPRGYEEAMEDTSVVVTVVGDELHLSSLSLAKSDAPTIYIAGDSTVTDQSAEFPYLPEKSYCGWGQMLSYFVGNKYAISNHAHSGLTTNSMRSEGHYQVLLDRIGEGDICLFQFGHNDQKLDELKADEAYRDNLNRYIDEIRAKGATTIIVTPLARNSWKGNDGGYNDFLSEYARVCIEVADERKTPLLDLHAKSMKLITDLGCEASKKYFFPSDYTHSNDYGAYLFASFIYDELAREGITEKKSFDRFIPLAEPRSVEIPRECQDRKNPDEVILFENIDRPDEALVRHEAFQMLIETMRFFPTNVYNDMFTDVLGHETYAGSVECAYQNGMIPDDFTTDGKVFPNKEVTNKEFFEILVISYMSRKSTVLSERDVFGEDYNPEEIVTRGRAAEICRGLKI